MSHIQPVSFLAKDWHRSQEGQEHMATIMQRNMHTRKVFGLLEKPSFPPAQMPDEYQYKIFVSGKSGVGKTSTVARLSGNDVPNMHSETPGIQTSVVYWPARMLDIDKVVLFHLQFWDAGENALKKFDHILPACKDKIDAVLFLFSFVDKSSFEDLPQQMSRILEPGDNACKFFMGTKLDLHAHSEITQRDIWEFEHQWQMPIMKIRNTQDYQADGRNEILDIAPILNALCDQLWLRDQVLAGRVTGPSLRDYAQT